MGHLIPSSKNSYFQNEVKCKTFAVKMIFIWTSIKNHFQINGFALSLALKQKIEIRTYDSMPKHQTYS